MGPDDEADALAEAAMRREGLMPLPELCKTVTELAAVVAEQSEEIKKLKARAEKRKVWNWHTATKEQREEWISELQKWLDEYLFVQFPWTNHPYKVPPCWANHPESVHALATLYQTWQKAYAKQDDPDLGGWWLTKWLDVLISRAHRPTTLCSGGQCRVTKVVVLEQPSMPDPEPDPVPSIPSRDDGRGRGDWTTTMS